MALRFTKLDRPSIRRLKLGEKITEHGITAERLKDGDVRYSVNVMVDGERVHRVVGRESDSTTRTQAEQGQHTQEYRGFSLHLEPSPTGALNFDRRLICSWRGARPMPILGRTREVQIADRAILSSYRLIRLYVRIFESFPTPPINRD